MSSFESKTISKYANNYLWPYHKWGGTSKGRSDNRAYSNAIYGFSLCTNLRPISKPDILAIGIAPPFNYSTSRHACGLAYCA